MHTSSPLATIYHVIQQVLANAVANASIFQKNEAATRAGLIDPILRALGWNTGNVQMVEPEKKTLHRIAHGLSADRFGMKPMVCD